MRKRICHVITGLPRAGAQRVLVDLLAHRDRARFDAHVVSLLPRDALADDVEAQGASLWCADLGRDARLPVRLASLAGHLRAARPDLVHTWMVHGDVIGGLAARAVRPGAPVVWHLHHGAADFDRFRASTRAFVRGAAWLSQRLPTRIIACAESSRAQHVARGYDASKMVVVRNGVDIHRFRPRSGENRPLATELGLTEPVHLIGLVARAHPHKDHATFLAAARELASARPDVHFVLTGAGVDGHNPTFSTVARHPQVHLLGERDDVHALLPQLDLSTLSSIHEACSLVLLESMASGVPCVATDVGDSAYLVGDTGRVVPPRSPSALARAWAELLDTSLDARRALGAAARARVEAEFDLPRVARAIEGVYERVLD